MGRDGLDWRRGWVGVPKGQKLTASKKVKGAKSALVHGKGVKAQAVFRLDKPRAKASNALMALLGFAAKSLFVVAALAVVLGASVLLLGAVAPYLMIALALASVAAVAVLGIRITLFFFRRWANKRTQPTQAVDSAGSAVQYVVVNNWGPVAQDQRPGWYSDPSNPPHLRYWDGVSWTQHVATVPSAQGPAQSSGRDRLPATDPRLRMTTAEWQGYVRAWLTAGAVEQELWHRVCNAHISDADPLTIAAKQRMEQLTPAQGTQQIRQILEANPGLRDSPVLSDFLRYFLSTDAPLNQAPAQIERGRRRWRPKLKLPSR